MKRLSSNLKTANVCIKCNRNLMETEVFFYGNKCTDCIYKEQQLLIKKG